MKNNKKAFTLIEFLIYIGIVTIVLLAAGAITFNVIYGKAKLDSIEELNYSARLAMNEITESIKSADLINSPVQGESASSLSLQFGDALVDPKVFDLSDGVLRVKEGDGAAVSITPDEVRVTELSFFNLSYDGSPGTIRVKMMMEFNNPSNRQEYNFENTFYTTVNIRKK